jgi:hypothetical protein
MGKKRSAEAVVQKEDMKVFLLGSRPKKPIISLPVGTTDVLTETEFSCINVLSHTTRRNSLSVSLFQAIQNSFLSVSLQEA